MDIIKRQYNSVTSPSKPAIDSNKNPNRVAGGIRGAGTDMVSVVDESGQERHIPTKKYISALEDQIRQERNRITGLESKLNRLARNHSNNKR